MILSIIITTNRQEIFPNEGLLQLLTETSLSGANVHLVVNV